MGKILCPTIVFEDGENDILKVSGGRESGICCYPVLSVKHERDKVMRIIENELIKLSEELATFNTSQALK